MWIALQRGSLTDKATSLSVRWRFESSPLFVKAPILGAFFIDVNVRLSTMKVNTKHHGVFLAASSVDIIDPVPLHPIKLVSSFYCNLLLSLLIYYYLLLSIVIYYYLLLSIVIYYYLLLSLIISCYLLLSLVIYCYLLLSIAIYCFVYV